MGLSDLTSPTAIRMAIRECDELGRDAFLHKYGFGLAREYVLRYNGKEYDSKAIGCVAYGIQHPNLGVLRNVSGGESGVGKRVFQLGFDVEGFTRNSEDWTLDECEIAADAYVDCLRKMFAPEPHDLDAVLRSVEKQLNKPPQKVLRRFFEIDTVLSKKELPHMINAFERGIPTVLKHVVLDPLAERYRVLDAINQELAAIFIFGSSSELPNSTEQMREHVGFQLSEMLLPSRELQRGNVLYWYESRSQRIVWKTSVTRTMRFEYKTKAEAAEKLTAFCPGDHTSRDEFAQGPDEGIGFAFQVMPLRRLAIPKPDQIRVIWQGWHEFDFLEAQLWFSNSVELPPDDLSCNSAQRNRAAAQMDDYRQSTTYEVAASQRVLTPDHQRYQIDLKMFLKARCIDALLEKNFIDVQFSLHGRTYIGEVKPASEKETAFRNALGQLLEYAHLRFDELPEMIMFLDGKLDDARLRIATKYGIAVVVRNDGSFRLLNAQQKSPLTELFAPALVR